MKTATFSPVVVAIDHCYNDNDGAYSIAFLWDGESVTSDCFANGHNQGRFDDVKVNASEQQKADAANWWQANKLQAHKEELIGCTVVLQRSRKAPNKTPLLVVNYDAGGYNARFNQYDPEQIAVNIDGAIVWVSIGCVKEVVKGKRPWWA